MNTNDDVEMRAEVLATAEVAAGFRPSEKQLKDWRRAGLFHRPLDQRGAGRKHGSNTYYPAGSGALLAEICRHCKPKKPLPELAFLVWWNGYDLPDMGLVRTALCQTLDEWERLATPWRNLDTVLEAEWNKLGPRLPPHVRSVHNRAGKGPFQYTMATLLNVAAGGFAEFRPYSNVDVDEAQDDMRAALGFDEATWIPDDISEALADLSAIVEPAALRDMLDEATGSDLNQTRDEVRDLVSLIDTVQFLVARLGGTGELEPLSHLGSKSLTAGMRGGVILFWLSASRHAAARRHYRQLLPVMQTVATVRSMLTASENQPYERMLPRRLAPSGSVAQGEDSSTCIPSLAPHLATP